MLESYVYRYDKQIILYNSRQLFVNEHDTNIITLAKYTQGMLRQCSN